MRAVFLLLLGVTATTAFHCGTDKLQNGFAEALVKNDCKGRVGEFDDCCADHDDCYKERVAQKTCDNEFCACVRDAARGKPGCQFHATTFCTTVRTFGAIVYNNKKG